MQHDIKVGDKVLSTWSLNADAFAQPKVVNDVSNDTIYAGGVYYHADDVVVIEQRPDPEAMAKRHIYVATHDLAEDCVIALDELLCNDDVEVEDIPPWLITTGSLVVDLI